MVSRAGFPRPVCGLICNVQDGTPFARRGRERQTTVNIPDRRSFARFTRSPLALLAVCVALGTGASTAALDPHPTPVAAYSFDEGAGGALADVTGNGHHGVLHGPAWTTGGRFGGGLTFDGIDDLVEIADAAALRLSSGLTVEAWVFQSSRRWGAAVAKPSDPRAARRDEDVNDPVYGLYTRRSPEAMLVLRAGTRTETLRASLDGNRREWMHVAATFDGTTARVYINGQLLGSRRARGLIAPSMQPLWLGRDSTAENWFAGTLDEVRIYDRALTADQIRIDMETPLGGAAPDAEPPTVSVVPSPQLIRTSRMLGAPVPLATAIWKTAGRSALMSPVGGVMAMP